MASGRGGRSKKGASGKTPALNAATPNAADALGAPPAVEPPDPDAPGLEGAVTVAVIQANQNLEPPSEGEKAQVREWLSRIESALNVDRDTHKDWMKWRSYASGAALKKWYVTTNIVASTLNALLPHVYARDPEIDIRPAEAVSESSYEATKRWGRTARILIEQLMTRARLKKKMKRLVRSTFVVGFAWFKVSFQTDTRKDPIIIARLESTKHNLDAIAEILDDMDDDDGHATTQNDASSQPNPMAHPVGAQDVDSRGSTETDPRAQLMLSQEELQQQMQALAAKVEVSANTGMVIDNGRGEDLIFPVEVREIAEDYAESPWIAQRIWFTPKEAERVLHLTDADRKRAKVYSAPMDTRVIPRDEEGFEKLNASLKAVQGTEWLCCYEIWDRLSNNVYTIVDGIDQYVRQPYVPDPQTERFYPFFVLAFHPVDDQRWPNSDVEMIHKLQDEYSRTRSNFAKHRERAVPARFGRAAAFTTEDAKKLANPSINEFVLLEKQEVDIGTPLTNQVGLLPYPQIDPGLYNVQPITFDLEQVIGLQDAARTAVQQPKTATEAEIIQNSMVNRVTERQDILEDLLRDVAIYVLQYTSQAYTQDDVINFAGMGSVWPRMPMEQIYMHLNLEVRPGSSGRPMRQMEQQNWAMLAPQIQQTIIQIDQLQRVGNQPLADALKALLKETARRIDVRIDIDLFLPPAPAAASVQQIPFQQNPEAAAPLVPYKEPPLPEPLLNMPGGTASSLIPS